MLGAVLGLAVWLGGIIAFFWSLDALRTLKDGQKEILQRLHRLESQNRTADSLGEAEDVSTLRG
jgi:hypothetical protein